MNHTVFVIVVPNLIREYSLKGKLRSFFQFVIWARETAMREARAELTEEHGLTSDPLDDPDATFTFLQFALDLIRLSSTSISKARKHS